jgi:hypothetical protein
MNKGIGFAVAGLAIAALALSGCGKKTEPEPTPTPTSTPVQVVPTPVAGSYNQIAFQREDVPAAPFANFLIRAQADARTYWRRDASLRQVDVEYDPAGDQLGYQLRFISFSKLVSGNPDTLTVYHGYAVPLIETVDSRSYQPVIDPGTQRLVGLSCEQDGACNTTSYAGRPPLPGSGVQLSFPEAYNFVVAQLRPLLVGQTPPYQFSLQVEAGQPQWIFSTLRVHATSGAVTSLST